MNKFDYLIIGGSAAGTTAAETIRKFDQAGSIAIVTEEPHRLYSRILLPFYLKNNISRERLFLKSPDFYQQQNIQLATSKRAVKLKPKEKQVEFDDGGQLGYSKLLLATGGKVNLWQVPGARLPGIFYLRTVEDGDAILAKMAKSKQAIVVGGGFVGLEFATSFVLQGLATTVLVLEPYYWQGRLDEESGNLLKSILEKNGAQVLTSEETAEVEGDEEIKAVITKSGKRLPADLIGVGIGIYHDIDWLADSGLKIERGIITNEYLETNLPDIFAAGDIAQFHDVIFDRHHQMGNWANAVAQGLVVGENMAAPAKRVFETVSAYSINFFDGNVSFVGVTDVAVAAKIAKRGSGAIGKIGQLFFGSGNRLIGATLINLAAEAGVISALIKQKTAIENPEKLASLEFDLKSLS